MSAWRRCAGGGATGCPVARHEHHAHRPEICCAQSGRPGGAGDFHYRGRSRAGDLPCLPALQAGLNFIRLATPTTDERRLPAVLANTSGFVYYVSITGITGAAAPDSARTTEAVARIKRHSGLPVAVGFGVRTAEQAAA